MPTPQNGADALLQSLKANGVDYLLVNAGSDFAPIIESYARNEDPDAFPTPVIVAHESVAVAMAHGYYLATGRPQAVMVHVNVGLANAAMGLINAHSDNIPLIMLSGRTPITEHERVGARVSPIQYGQEMFDQTALVREATKFNYEMRYAEQAATLVSRAYAIAMSEPKGPVYLSLPREPLAEPFPQDWVADRPVQRPTAPSGPNLQAVHEAAELIANAKSPLMILQRGDSAGRVGHAAARLAAKHAIKTIEVNAIHNVVAGDHPMLMLDRIEQHLSEADVVLVVDATVPWVENKIQPATNAKIIHVGADPLFQRMPMRSFRTDLAIAGETATTMVAIADALDQIEPETGDRYTQIEALHDEAVAARTEMAASGRKAPTNPAWVSHCISEILTDEAVIVSERGPKTNQLMLKQTNQMFCNAYSGGLGWGIPAAIGVSLADRERLTIAIVGDGSYMFANPVACHQVMEAHKLPVLVIVLNNQRWNAVYNATTSLYPDGEAAKASLMPMTDLSIAPDFVQVAQASRAYAERVEDGVDLPAALQRALHAVRVEKRQALLEIRVDDTMI